MIALATKSGANHQLQPIHTAELVVRICFKQRMSVM